LRDHEQELRALGARVVLVAFSPWEELEALQAQVPGDWLCLHDPEREVYARYRLGRMSVGRVFTLSTIAASLRALRRRVRPGRLHAEDKLQLGGDFLIDADGILRFAHYAQDPGDRPAGADFVARLRALTPPAP
jgi:hypothetical protein